MSSVVFTHCSVLLLPSECAMVVRAARSPLHAVHCALYILSHVAAHIVRFRPNATAALSTNTHHAIVISPLENDCRIRLRIACIAHPAVRRRMPHRASDVLFLPLSPCWAHAAPQPTFGHKTSASAESTASACSGRTGAGASVKTARTEKAPTVRRQREWRMNARKLDKEERDDQEAEAHRRNVIQRLDRIHLETAQDPSVRMRRPCPSARSSNNRAVE